ncbi:hypothetical protein SKUN_00925 [Spiroplasma kunkelii CR2-3x]|uniref:Transmembrane protein n=1 Tax=Spiroplasma kunkelii CR2-3x TaxID=273035 RepID=A0A0K2JHC1_SPIKU|nr:hypothetical protein [Spiroplasma kunkelii]ALA97812.1 hypothetical protein SKUN_00925 [Spiroplasma kunkelii CR2-3x]
MPVQNEQENVQINVIQNKKPYNLCRAVCIIAIVISSLALIGFSIGGLILGLILLVTGTMSYGFYMVTRIFYLIIAGIEIIPIIMCNNVLKGKA